MKMEEKKKIQINYKPIYPPCIFYSVTSNITYLCCGNIWFEIPNDTELSEIEFINDKRKDYNDILWEFFGLK